MISVKKVSRRFKDTLAVNQVSFEVATGETLVLLGTSGSGKTTLLKMLNRLIEPSNGEIWLNGSNTLQQNAIQLRRNIGYVIQHQGLFPHYTVAENIAVVPKLLKWPKKKTLDRCHELLNLLSLPPKEYLHRYPHELSGGQQQRISIARALAANPPVMLMDEPFGALDPITRSQIQQEFLSLEELLGKTTVLVTHDVFEAIILGDKICLMDKGKIQQQGTPKELIFKPANTFVKEFFNASRFQYELKVQLISDILPYLQHSRSITNKCMQVDSKTDLLQVMEDLSRTGNTFIRVSDSHNSDEIILSRDDILSGLSAWKKDFIRS